MSKLSIVLQGTVDRVGMYTINMHMEYNILYSFDKKKI